jgi:hypothetical protein
MPLRLSLINTDSAQSDPKPRQNFPRDTGDFPRNHLSFPVLIQNEPTAARAPDVHADLQAVITAWPTLSEAVRAMILRLIQGEEVRHA